jgi:hypothetical protein
MSLSASSHGDALRVRQGHQAHHAWSTFPGRLEG